MRGKEPRRTGRARALRRASTRAELILWRELCDRRLAGCKFVRQAPVGPYFVGFICRERRLIVEVDGGQHAESRLDQVRDAALAALGYRVIRVWNNDVLGNIEGVLQMLKSELEAGPSPCPSPRDPRVKPGEGEGTRGIVQLN